MSESEALDLLRRNLLGVFGERDDAKRWNTICEIYTEDAHFVDHNGAFRGRDEINRAAQSLQQRFPQNVFREIRAQSIGKAGRIEWSFGAPTQASGVRGVDVAAFEGDRICAMYTFLD
jgi:SnoaL-like domain